MLLSYQSLSQKPRVFHRLTGMTLSEFSEILEKIDPLLKTAFGVMGRRRKLSTSADKLSLLLIYYRTYVSHEFLGYFVGLDNSNVCRLFQRLEPLVAKAIHIKKDRRLTEDKVTELIIDATEQPIQRPTQKKARKRYYSGKKKRHTQKVEISMDRRGKILTISKSVPGRQHDFRLRQQSDPLPPEAIKYVDLGYQGLDHLTHHVLLPYKKPPGGQLTKAQKAKNREHSKIRIAIEHKFAQIKQFKILSEIYRNFRRKHHLRFNIIAGIINYQAGF